MATKKTKNPTLEDADKALPDVLTCRQLERVFGVSGMTIHNWRFNAKNKTLLPSKTDAEGRVTLRKKAVLKWAKTNEVPIVSIVV